MNIPWSDLLGGDEKSGGNVRQAWSDGDLCRHHGCACLYTTRGGGCGLGYCTKHYRNLMRSGDPEGMTVARWRRLTEAVLARADGLARLADLDEAVMAAAFDAPGPMLYELGRQGSVKATPRRERPVPPAVRAALMAAGDAYADAEEDADFMRARAKLKEACTLYRDSTVVWYKPLLPANEPAGELGAA